MKGNLLAIGLTFLITLNILAEDIIPDFSRWQEYRLIVPGSLKGEEVFLETSVFMENSSVSSQQVHILKDKRYSPWFLFYYPERSSIYIFEYKENKWEYIAHRNKYSELKLFLKEKYDLEILQ